MNVRRTLTIAGTLRGWSRRCSATTAASFASGSSRGDFDAAGLDFATEQANLSMSSRNVVRGLHYSLAPRGQAKVVTCVLGELDDVIVDVRVGSPTFGAVEIVHLAADQGRSVVLPAGVAHGFCVTSEHAALVVPAVVALQRPPRARDQSLRPATQRRLDAQR